MRKYFEAFRPAAIEEQNGEDCGVFFLTRRGTQLTSGRIASIFDTLGRKYGRTDKGRLFPTKFRQTAATSVSRKPQEQREDLSHLMTHKVSTQRTYYVLDDTIERSLNAHAELTKVFNPDDEPEETKTGRPTSTDEIIDKELKRIFEQEIKQRSLIPLSTVQAKKETSVFLKNEDGRKLVKRLRYLSAQERMPVLPELPDLPQESSQEKVLKWKLDTVEEEEDDDASIIPPSTAVGTHLNRRIWDPKYEKVLLKECKSLFRKGAKLPRTHEVKKIIKESTNEDLKMLVLTFGKTAPARILSKCKTMYLSMSRKNELL